MVTKKPCLQIFRYRENNYATDNRIVYSHEWRYLKSKSCKGECKRGHCNGPFEDIQMAGMEGLEIDDPQNPKDGQLYEAVFVPSTPDYETGYVEDWYWTMREWSEE